MEILTSNSSILLNIYHISNNIMEILTFYIFIYAVVNLIKL